MPSWPFSVRFRLRLDIFFFRTGSNLCGIPSAPVSALYIYVASSSAAPGIYFAAWSTIISTMIATMIMLQIPAKNSPKKPVFRRCRYCHIYILMLINLFLLFLPIFRHLRKCIQRKKIEPTLVTRAIFDPLIRHSMTRIWENVCPTMNYSVLSCFWDTRQRIEINPCKWTV